MGNDEITFTWDRPSDDFHTDIREYLKLLYGSFEENYRNTPAGCAINRGAKLSMDLIEEVFGEVLDGAGEGEEANE